MRPVAMILRLSKISFAPGLIKTFIRRLYSDPTTNSCVASCTTFVGVYFALPSGIGMTTGKHLPLKPLHAAETWAA